MVTAGHAARQKYNPDYAIAGQDGVHPGWAGSFVMAYAFLKGLGLDGRIGTITVDLGTKSVQLTEGHELAGTQGDEIEIKSVRYPYCATGDVAKDDSIRSAMTLVGFNAELNRLMLVARNAKAANYKVTW